MDEIKLTFSRKDDIKFIELYNEIQDVAYFYFKDYPNKEYRRVTALRLVKFIVALLSPDYSLILSNKWSEQNECFITYDEYNTSVRVTNKYWSNKRITAFKEIVKALAKLNNWDVIEY